MDDNEFQAYTQQVEKLVERVNALPDENARSAALELLQAVMDLHGAALRRVVELLSESELHHDSLSKLASDPMVCGLLVLYGIHPIALTQRVAQAVEKLRPELKKQGASLELVSVTDDGVRLKVDARTHGLAASPEKIRGVVEHAILEAAPEIPGVTIEGIAPSGFVPLSQIQSTTKEKAYEESTA
jgi:hypothetical protein